MQTLAELLACDMVVTWVNHAYAERDAFGDVLADEVDAGGRVLVGQRCLPTAGNYLAGDNMDQTLNDTPFSASNYVSGLAVGHTTGDSARLVANIAGLGLVARRRRIG